MFQAFPTFNLSAADDFGSIKAKSFLKRIENNVFKKLSAAKASVCGKGLLVNCFTFRSLSFIEDYIRDQVLPEYGNTHTTSNVTSLQTTLYRHEAR